ncbi:hypothetical protein ACFP56_14880 [Paenibacillus septentrionalis]|uniref:Uncharacterized protein n=1 Tax=Paenibacillus septentrionalis TaxID=429342 RepID=A0ABW1V871_9BACL
MKLVIAGNCEKHDYILTIAVLLRGTGVNSIVIVTDSDKHYKYFDGEFDGIGIKFFDGEHPEADYVIYDWHHGFPPNLENFELVFVTSYERDSLENLKTLYGQPVHPKLMVVIEEDCKINLQYVRKLYPMKDILVSYFASSERKINTIHDCKVQLKVDKDFEDAVNELLETVYGIQRTDIKKLWRYVKKRR